MSPSQIKFLVAHELGHMFGLRHTNWRATESEYSMYDGIQIGAYTVWGTNNSSTNPDPTSVFNSHTCGFEWNGFSNDDLIAINQLFSTNIVPAEE